MTGWLFSQPCSRLVGYYVTSYSCHIVHSWRLQPENERCQLIKAHTSSGDRGHHSGTFSVSGIFGTKCGTFSNWVVQLSEPNS